MDVYDFNLDEYIAFARLVGTDTEGVEIKAAAGGLPKSIVETLSAFANTGGGVIVLGLSERSGFRPAKGFDARGMADALAQACSEKMEPPVRASVDIVPFEGASVVVAAVPGIPPYMRPCYVKARTLYEGTFVRMGDGDRRLSPYEVDRMLEGRHQPQFDNAIVPEADVGEFEPELLNGFLFAQREESYRAFKGMSDDEVLETLRVVVRDGDGVLRPTLAGLMALARYPQKHYPRACVSFARYPGVSKADVTLDGLRFLDSKNLTGPIPIMIAETMICIRRNMRVASKMDGAFRIEEPEYPEAALREAIANALLHRDYSPEGLTSQVQVNMYDNRIEVMSPGGLCQEMTIDRLGELGVSFSRNQTLARLLESTSYPTCYAEQGRVVENKGTGYFQMRRSMQKAGHPDPVPRDYLSAFVVELYGKGVRDEACWKAPSPVPQRETPLGRAMKKAGTTASERRLRTVVGAPYSGAEPITMHVVEGSSVEYAIVELMEEASEPVKSSFVIESLGKSKATISRALNRLIDKGLVERVGGKKGPGITYRLARDLAQGFSRVI